MLNVFESIKKTFLDIGNWLMSFAVKTSKEIINGWKGLYQSIFGRGLLMVLAVLVLTAEVQIVLNFLILVLVYGILYDLVFSLTYSLLNVIIDKYQSYNYNKEEIV